MHWLVLAAFILAIVFIQLGAMSVWVVVLFLALKILLAIAGMVALYVAVMYLWRRCRKRGQAGSLTTRIGP